MPRKRFSDDDDDDDTPAPRRKKRGRRPSRSSNTGLIVGLSLGGVFLVVVVVVAVILLGRSRDRVTRDDPSAPPPDPREDATIRMLKGFEPPATWSHKDLADHLGSKGLRVEIREDAGLATRYGKGVWLEDPTRKTVFLKVPRPPRVRVYLCNDVRSTHRQCTAVENEGGAIPFMLGRFVVGAPVMTRGDDQSCDNADLELRDRIRNVLEASDTPKK